MPRRKPQNDPEIANALGQEYEPPARTLSITLDPKTLNRINDLTVSGTLTMTAAIRAAIHETWERRFPQRLEAEKALKAEADRYAAQNPLTPGQINVYVAGGVEVFWVIQGVRHPALRIAPLGVSIREGRLIPVDDIVAVLGHQPAVRDVHRILDQIAETGVCPIMGQVVGKFVSGQIKR